MNNVPMDPSVTFLVLENALQKPSRNILLRETIDN